MTWRWDQGRLEYFLFSNVRNIAHALYDLNNASLDHSDPLRGELQSRTGLRFLPMHYTVWRNYKRVFGCSLLATSLGDRLAVTDMTKLIVEKNITADDYFSLFMPRFYFPSPIFESYRPAAKRSFPFCAVMRFLVSQPPTVQPGLSLDDAFNLLVANEATGAEPQKFYLSLRPRSISVSPDQKRQVREMLIFFSQFSPLKWVAGRLTLDLSVDDAQARQELFLMATPLIRDQHSDRSAELLRMAYVSETAARYELAQHVEPSEEEVSAVFPEGRRIMAYHSRVERSPGLRKLFARSKRFRWDCDMCTEDLRIKYPWTGGFFEIHHVLPLSSPIWLSLKGVSLDDVRGMCPNCHRSAHKYYGRYLTDAGRPDFSGKEEAADVYAKAKTLVRRYGPLSP